MGSGPEERHDEETRSYHVLAAGTEVSQYRIVEKIGAGGMGEVYLADDTKLNRRVALKFLLPQYTADEELKARFTREAQAAAALNHPNIITIHEVAAFEGRPFMAMEFVPGRSLRELASDKALSMGELINLAMQIGEGLHKAHEAGIVHRDIKPQNILIDNDGRIKITDFGLAKVRGEPKLTQAGTTFGTMAYMSPEQTKGLEVDRRADIFSFGVVLYEMITGTLPFKGDNEAAIINAIVNQVPEPLARYKSQVPEELERMIGKALAKNRDERYQHMDDLVTDLRRERKRIELMESTQLLPGTADAAPRRKLLPILVPAAIVIVAALIIFVLFVLEPFRVEMGPGEQAVAEENTLAIMYFDNMVDRSDEARLGEIITELLITDLSGSDYLNVVSSQRLYDILRLLGKEGIKRIDRTVATEVATRAGAKWMLMGSVLQVEPQTILTLQLVEVESGRVLASRRLTGEPGETVFSMVDDLTVEIKSDLALPAQAKGETDPAVADVTTDSPEAYRYWLEGIDHARKFYFLEAEQSFRRALEYDSTFAMVYYRLAMMRPGPEGKEFMAKAVAYSENASEKEQYYIRSLAARGEGDFAKAVAELEELTEHYPQEKVAFYMLGTLYRDALNDYGAAVEMFNKAIEVDPLYKEPYNLLSYTYNSLGQIEKALWAINKYIELAPGESNPLDSKGDLYASHGRIAEAMEAYRKALEIKPDFYYSLTKLGHMYLFQQQYARAESCYKQILASTDRETRSGGRSALALIPAYQGKFAEALAVLDNGIAADGMEQAQGLSLAAKHFFKAGIYRGGGKLDEAIREAGIGAEIMSRVNPGGMLQARMLQVRLLTEAGRHEEAGDLLAQIETDAGKEYPTRLNYDYALGIRDLAKGDADSAVARLERVIGALPQRYYASRYDLARAYLAAGRVGAAVTELEGMLSSYEEARATAVPTADVRARYLLGKAYEESGWQNKAIEQYEEFLDIWKDADPGLDDVEDARARLAVLKENT
jgi:tetratricopeptide (TPR) repeat protein/TolB-like protein/predicted Ser/Thr protein kinase